MKISGVATMHAPADQVWAVLTDPNVLVATIPGCERLEAAGPGSYRFAVAAAVASIHGVYTGEISLSEQLEPSSFTLTASGAGGPGTVSTSVQVRLADANDGSTELSYDADAVIAGLIAGVGQRMLSSIAQRTAAEFFSSLDDILAGTGVAGQTAALAEPGAVPVSMPVSTAPVRAAPQPAARVAPERRRSSVFHLNGGFARGVLAGAAVTLAGMAVARMIGRRAR